MSTEREKRLFDEVGRKIKRETDCKSFHMGRKQLLGPPPGILNTITPCAACKLLRRRCAEECPFSPYFSPHEPHKFAAVHKVFGASNVSKMIMDVAENQRADAVNSLVFEANLRLRDPVYGCMGAISALQHQLHSLQTELNAVRAEILKYKYREAAAAAAASTIISSSTHAVALVSSDSDSITAVALPASLPPPHLSLPPPTPPVGSSTSPPSSASSFYTVLPSSTTGYSSITSDHNIPYYE